jgi:translocation and assembly module TamB
MIAERNKIKPPLIKRILRIFLIVLLSFLVLIVLIVLLIQTAPVQNFLKNKAISYLQSKIRSKVVVGRIDIGFPKTILFKDVFFEDKNQDTLFSASKLGIDLGMWKLLHGDIAINDFQLEQATIKIKRLLPDTSYNFQYIVDAFASKNKEPVEPKDSKPTQISINKIELDKISFLFQDTITGNNLKVFLNHFSIKVDRIDLKNEYFEIPAIDISGLTGNFHQSKPLIPAIEPLTKTASPQLVLNKVSLNNLQFDFASQISSLDFQVGLKQVLIKVKAVDLTKKIINLEDLQLSNTTASIHVARKSNNSQVYQDHKVPASADTSSWRIGVGVLDINNNNIAYMDDNHPIEDKGIDFSHFSVTGLVFHAKDILYTGDSIAALISKASFTEKSGFQLISLKGKILYSGKEANIKDMELKTPNTILRSSISLQYPSVESFKKNIGTLKLDLDVHNSRILIKDILAFAPSLSSKPVFADPNATISINTKMKGRISDLKIEDFQLTGLHETHIELKGDLSGLPSIKSVKGNLLIKTFSSSSRDIASLIPSRLLPASFSIPAKWNLNGTIKGSLANLLADLSLKTSDGDLRIKGGFRNLDDAKNIGYDAILSTESLDLGAILKNPKKLGDISLELKAKGNGTDPKTMNADISGTIHSVLYNQYDYHNANFKTTIKKEQLNVDLNFLDPNLSFTAIGSADLDSKFSSFKLKANIDSINTAPLHLTKDNIFYHGIIDADFPQANLDQLKGEMQVEQSLLVKNGRKIALDTIHLIAGKTDSGQFLNLSTDFFHVGLAGRYKLTQMGSVFRQIIDPYFSTVSKDSVARTDPYHFTISAGLINKPVIKMLLPDMERLDPISFLGSFDSENGWLADFKAPNIIYAGNHIQNLQLHSKPDSKALVIETSFKQFTYGSRFSLYNTSFNAVVANDKIEFVLNIQDKSSKDKYHIGGIVQQKENSEYIFSLHPEKLLLNYQKWSIAKDNEIRMAQSHISANHFNLKKDLEELNINSVSTAANSPLEFYFNKFLLSTLTDFAGSDSSLANGELAGKFILDHSSTKTSFTSDLTIQNLSVYGDTVGNIAVKVNHTIENSFSANMLISGRENDVELKGDFISDSSNSRLNLELQIRRLQLESIAGLSFGSLKSAAGFVNGKFTIQGPISQPKINGNLTFNQAVFIPNALNSRFFLDKESLQFNNNAVKFSHFTILDSAKNALVLDGELRSEDFKLYNFDLTLSAKHFEALNSTKKDNKLYYGQFYFNADLTIKGSNLQPSVDGSIRIDKKTKLTIVLPQQEPGIEDRKGIVEFVNMKSTGRDSILNLSYDSIGKSSLKGFDISTNIVIDSTAEISMVIDESNGDILVAKGDATLTGGIDRSGKITLTGSYQLSHGSYDLSFSLLHRKFDIQRGSTITWTGDPTKARLDIDAIYLANAPPIDLVQDQIAGTSATVQNTYQQKLPFELHLKMKGEILKPEISFDIVLPDDKAYNVSKDMVTTVQTKLVILRQDQGEMNKQVFALLILGRFVADDPFSTSSAGANAESIVRASVSKILSQQLNQIASNLVHGVDINFDLQSTDDYTTGQLENRTDLNVSLSKKLLSDRLIVTVGSDFERPQNVNANTQSNSLAGNIALGYKLSKDGRYLLRAYRRNDYDDVVEGYVIETGIGFVITIDYDHFREIFESKKKKVLELETNK